MVEQITMLRSEVLQILRHVHEIRTEIEYLTNILYEEDYDEIENMLNVMRAHADNIIRYFEIEHHIGIKTPIK